MDIIFDICGVMLEWKPDQIIEKYFKNPQVITIVKTDLLHHSDWKELDKGTITKEDIIQRSSARTGLPIAQIGSMITSIPGTLLPIPGTIKIIRSLKGKGHRLFILSNMPFMSIDYVEPKYPFFNLFEGKIISCRVNMIKPDPEIYIHLLTKFNVRLESTIFIDDSDINIRAAEKLGIRSIQFINPKQCEFELIHAGCL
jgi:putative hydrolase of the HAD superfamily